MAKLHDAPSDVRMTPNNSQILKQLNAKLVSTVERMQRYYKGDLIYGNKSDRAVFLVGIDPYKSAEHVKIGTRSEERRVGKECR